MPIIIDANRVCDFKFPLSNHAPEIVRRITAKKMSVVVGGKLLKELAGTHIRDLLVEWTRSGRLKKFDDSIIDEKELAFKLVGIKSDDPHVLALAFVSKSRLLYTEDNLLIEDFKNVDLLSPKGKILLPSTKYSVSVSLFNLYGS